MTDQQPLISLEEAKELVTLIEQGDAEAANDMLHSVTLRQSNELFSEVGKLTRQLHDSMVNFSVDGKLEKLTSNSIPNAQSDLEYVIAETEKAANSTMDAVEKSLPIAEQLNDRLTLVIPNWQKLMERQLEVGEFKSLCHELDTLLNDAKNDSAALNTSLTEVLMLQGYQDLTGQVIRRVIDLVNEVQEGLVDMLAAFSDHDVAGQEDNSQPSDKHDDKIKAEGPIIDAVEREDVAHNQDEVDDLLSSLGF